MEHRIYDKTMKELFSMPETVRDFLRGFVDEDFVNDIEFGHIEKRSTSYITKTYRDRYTDLVLKLNMKGGKCAYLYILFEFQSTVDRLMPLRILNYLLLFYEDLIKQKEIKPDGLLPPVFPVVLYSGAREYDVSTRLEDLIALPYKRLQKYVPHFEHYLMTLESKPRGELKRMTAVDNKLAGFFYMLTARTVEELREAERLLSALIETDTEFGRFYEIWLRTYLKHKGIMIKTHVREGGKIVLETLITTLKAESRAEGKAEGRQDDILKLLGKKFGVLPGALEQKIRSIQSPGKLEEILLAILDMTSLEDVEKMTG